MDLKTAQRIALEADLYDSLQHTNWIGEVGYAHRPDLQSILEELIFQGVFESNGESSIRMSATARKVWKAVQGPEGALRQPGTSYIFDVFLDRGVVIRDGCRFRRVAVLSKAPGT